MILEAEKHLEHYGTPRHSGRYPWGSGKNPHERLRNFLDTVNSLKKQGLSEAKIAEGMGIKTTELRARKTIALNELKQERINQAQRLKDKGYGPTAISKRMGIPEPTVRMLLAPGEKDKVDVLKTTAQMLREQVDKKTYLDVGTGSENHVGVSQTKLSTAVAILKEEGYKLHYVQIPQVGNPGKFTTSKVLTKPGVPYSEVYRNRGQIQQISDYSTDGGRSFLGIHPPLSISSKRIAVVYAEHGGDKADGVIYVRPNVKDLSLGGKNYAQVRIAVDGTHYIKGMAMYKDGLPPGKDLVFNTNKADSGHVKDALKPMKEDPDNPFGSRIKRQIVEVGPDGKQHVTSAMNIVNEAGDWGNWSKSLSSQMLSKQDPRVAKQQLDLTYENRVKDLKEIVRLTNPTVKRKLLETFADSADAAAVHLKAAHLPRQASHVILPVPSMKPTEIFAPNYHNGEKVVLIRYPHGGTFEIPQLTVNNRQPEARQLVGHAAQDAIGIHPDVAHHLSGADFDGDTVLVIPNNTKQVTISSPLEGLKKFDPVRSFPPYDGMKTIDGGTYHADTKTVIYPKGADGKEKKPASRKGYEMGNVTNLIADMTIQGANVDELARAVRHSMVVIDSEKHFLDYKASARQNGIAALKTRYQGSARAGAKTLITRATAQTRVLDRKLRRASEGGPIDPVTGEKVYTYSGKEYVNKQGKLVPVSTRGQKLAEAKDAYQLTSGTGRQTTPIERVYADHSNRLKALANQARKETVPLKSIPYEQSAKKVYANEVASLNAKLNLVLRRRPLERQAQILANAQVALRLEANPHMESADLKKIKFQALTEARLRTGVIKPGESSSGIEITPKEWEAIQAGAISGHKLGQILDKANLDTVKQLATPRTVPTMTKSELARAQTMVSIGYTQAEIASLLGIKMSTLKSALERANSNG